MIEVSYSELLSSFELQQFKSRPNSGKLLDAIAKQLQELSTQRALMAAWRLIDNAEGDRLDQLGRTVGESRAGRSDAAYREKLRTKIALNLTSGTTDDLLFFLVAYTGAEQARISPGYPAGLTAQVRYPVTVTSYPRLAAALRRVMAAGVELFGVVDIPVGPDDADFTVADEAERLALTEPPLAVGSIVLQLDTGSLYEYLGTDPTDPANWTLVGPALVFFEDTDDGEGLADLTEAIGTDYPAAGVLASLLAE